MAIRYIKLRCRGCESLTCEKKPLGSWASENEGCTKQVSALEGNKYFHYIVEVKPMIKQLEKINPQMYDELLEFIYYIHDLPAGERWKR